MFGLVTDDMPAKVISFPSHVPMTTTNVYLAARYDRLHEMQGYRDLLEGAGYNVVARWVNGEHEMQEGKPHLHHHFAKEDVEDVLRSDWVINFGESPDSTTRRGGRHVEFGIAVGLKKRLILIGHRENVFHHLPQVEFYRSWQEFWPE